MIRDILKDLGKTSLLPLLALSLAGAWLYSTFGGDFYETFQWLLIFTLIIQNTVNEMLIDEHSETIAAFVRFSGALANVLRANDSEEEQP